MDNVLVLVRHGESEWNKLNLFTGWKDPGLTEKGIAEAKTAGRLLKAQGYKFDVAFTSDLARAQRTLTLILEELEQTGLVTHKDQKLNERDYGDLSGLNKDEARQKWGEDQVHTWRRSYDIPPPGGESLKDTAARVLPYYQAKIWPEVNAGKNVLVAAHGNSLRALIMQLEGLSGEEIVARELATGAPIVYRLNADGTMRDRRDLSSTGITGSDKPGE
jgi:2,3-bisphosphoglycerate-dependent phosphoglycerate mutase